jgi:hypothetical protein
MYHNALSGPRITVQTYIPLEDQISAYKHKNI